MHDLSLKYATSEVALRRWSQNQVGSYKLSVLQFLGCFILESFVASETGVCCSWTDWCLYRQTSCSFYVLTILERETLKVRQEFPNVLCLYAATLETFHPEKLQAGGSCKSDVEYMSFINWSVVVELWLFVHVFAQVHEKGWNSTPEGNTTNYCIFCFEIIVVVVSVTCLCMWCRTVAVRLFVCLF